MNFYIVYHKSTNARGALAMMCKVNFEPKLISLIEYHEFGTYVD